jgi:hypothetical protein
MTQQAASAARTIALQMLQDRGRGAVLVGVARVDAALQTLQPMRNAFAHSMFPGARCLHGIQVRGE